LQGVNWGRDGLKVPRKDEIADLRKVKEGDKSPDGKGKLAIARGIEVGHIFQLGTKYSESMQALFVDEKGEMTPMEMGCYGIGVSRIVAAAIEQQHDERGILWPDTMAPFQVVLIGINAASSPKVATACEELYKTLQIAGFDVLWDDRAERPGVMFADMDLIGIPHRFVVSEKSLSQDSVEYKNRRSDGIQMIPQGTIVEFLKGNLDEL
jgi:prolyl-tRNA synthetase